MKEYDKPTIITSTPGPKALEVIGEDSTFMSTSLSRTAMLVGNRAHGSFVEDIDGNVYLDFGSGIAVTSMGHTHPKVVDAIKKQAELLIHVNSCDYLSIPQVEYAKRITSMTPGDFPKRVFFSNSGAEAIETAIKSAIYHTKKHGIISFLGGFHGRTMGALGLTSNSPVSRRYYTGSMMPQVVFSPYANPYRNRFSGDCAEASLAFLREEILGRILPPEDCAAIIFEPIQGAGGYIVPPKRFIEGLREIATENELLLIADEVQTGFGKTGYMFACEAFGIEPDIICLSKSIAAGLPMGATVARAELLEWDQNTHENTLGGNPVVLAAALAVLDVFEEEHLVEQARVIGEKISRGLRELQKANPIIGDVRGLGSMIGFELVKDTKSKTPAHSARDQLIKLCFESGLLILGAGASSVRLAPPLTMKAHEVELGLEILEESFGHLRDQY